jgi:hypothetical protein
MKGKCAETFGPLGPWLVTRDEIEDVQNLAMSLDVNGERRQTGNTKTMIFGIAHLPATTCRSSWCWSRATWCDGHAARVAQGMKPPKFLSRRRHDAQDRGLGEQKQKVVPFKE